MADFDPDMYLASTPIQKNTGFPSNGFDPDAYLASTASDDMSAAAHGITDPKSAASFNQDVNQKPGDTDPTGQKILEKMGTVAGGYGLGQLAGLGVSKAVPALKSVFSEAPTLANAGIKGSTIEGMAKIGQNPATVGENLENTLQQEGALGKDASTSWDKMNALKEQYGQRVGAALDRIRQTNKASGIYPELADPLKIDANSALKPLLDDSNALSKSGYPLDKFKARNLKAMYNSLSDKANANDGFLTFDHVQDEMGKVGQMMNAAGPNHIGIVKELYGRLYNIKDSMVNDIAEAVDDPSLKNELLEANAGYSRYSKLMDDVSVASAKQPLQQPSSIFRRVLPYALATAAGTIGGRGIYDAGKRILGGEP